MKHPENHEEKPLIPDELACSLPGQFWGSAGYADAAGSMAGMTEREQDELLLMSGSRKQRKAVMERRRADPNEHHREEFLLLYGTRKERKVIKERRKARAADMVRGPSAGRKRVRGDSGL